MNVFHWHMSDAQSFPFDSAIHVNISRGAFAPRAVYSPADITNLTEYARLRGIIVVVEIDMPGHSYAMTMGYPDLGVNCSQMQPLETEFWAGGLNPSVEKVYPFLNSFLAELTTLVPSPVFHLGGDEVQSACWLTDPKIVAYLKNNNMTTTQLYQQFLKRMMQTLQKLGRRPMTWDTLFLSNASMPEDAIVHAYPHSGNTTASLVARSGLDVVISSFKGDYLAQQ